MNGDHFTEVTRTSWGSRLGGSIRGVLIGGLLFLAAFPLLFWNESRTVSRARALEKGASAVVALRRSDVVDPASEGQLVWLTGEAVTDETLRDDEFALAVKAIRLRRHVEMHQWVEKRESRTQTKFGGGTETVTRYHYSSQWKDSPVDSGRFARPTEHANPPMPCKSQEWLAQRVSVGAFQLSPTLVRQIGGSQPLAFEQDGLRTLPEAKQAEWIVADGSLYRPAAGPAPGAGPAAAPPPALGAGPAAPNKPAAPGKPAIPGKSVGDAPARGDPFTTSVDTFSASTLDAAPRETRAAGAEGAGAHAAAAPPAPRSIPAKPAIGDVRVRFEVVRPQEVSVIAQQSGGALRAYQPKNSTSAIELLATGNVPAEAMFTRAKQQNALFAWMLRLAGFVMMAAGIGMLLAPLGVVADVIPFCGQIIRLGTGLASLVIAGVLSAVTIAIAWIAARPLLGLGLLALAAVLLVVAVRAGKSRPQPTAGSP